MLAGASLVHFIALGSSLAQGNDFRLARLDSLTRLAVVIVVDSAKRSRLPAEPLASIPAGLDDE